MTKIADDYASINQAMDRPAALTRDVDETIIARMSRDPEFRTALLAVISDEIPEEENPDIFNDLMASLHEAIRYLEGDPGGTVTHHVHVANRRPQRQDWP